VGGFRGNRKKQARDTDREKRQSEKPTQRAKTHCDGNNEKVVEKETVNNFFRRKMRLIKREQKIQGE